MSDQADEGKFSVQPSASFIDINETRTFSITRNKGGSTLSKLVIVYKAAPLDAEDAREVFKRMPERERIKSDRVDIPVSTTP